MKILDAMITAWKRAWARWFGKPKSGISRELLQQDAQILSICLSAFGDGPASAVSPTHIEAWSALLNGTSPPAGQATMDPQTQEQLMRWLEGIDNPDLLTDAALVEIMTALNGCDPAVINAFLQKLIGILDPATLEQLFNKIFSRLLGKSKKERKRQQEEAEKLSRETRQFLNQLRRETLKYLSDRLSHKQQLSIRYTTLQSTIERLSKAMAYSEIKSTMDFAGVPISPAFTHNTDKTGPDHAEPEPGERPHDTPDPDSNPPELDYNPKPPWKPPRI